MLLLLPRKQREEGRKLLEQMTEQLQKTMQEKLTSKDQVQTRRYKEGSTI